MSDLSIAQGNNEVKSTLQAALAYARRGWHVLAVHGIAGGKCTCGKSCSSPGKHPIPPRGFLDATTDEATIRGWWEREPYANVGVRTGVESGLVVADQDGPEGRQSLIGKHLPVTPTAITGRGEDHVHRYYAHPGGTVKSRPLLRGVDVKADGGYVVVPPSRHVSGRRYQWAPDLDPTTVPLAALPAWVVAPAASRPDETRAESDTAPIARGLRNTRLTQIGGGLRRRGCGQDEILASLRAVNATRCDPPLPDEEVAGIAASIARYPPGELAADPLAGLKTLNGEGDPQALRDALRMFKDNLRGADRLTREAYRGRAVSILDEVGVRSPARLVDAALVDEKQDLAGHTITLSDPEPWPEPVDGAELLDEIAATYRRFVILPGGGAVALALWTVFTHCLNSFDISPRLAFCSPVRRCGKTLSLTLLGALASRPLPSASITTAALFRGIEKYRPCLLIDEADTLFEKNEELRAVVNAGHTRQTARVLRTVGDEHEPRQFSTWGAFAVALIGKLPDALADRAVVLPMRRRAKGETVERLRLDRLGELEPLRRRAARWARDHHADLKVSDPSLPASLHDRALDNWRPLVAIADLAGGRWPALARQAATALTPGGDDADDIGVRLLQDVRCVFGAADRLPTAHLLATLHVMEDAPWAEWGRTQKPITGHALGRTLRRFGVVSRTMRFGATLQKGYVRDDFADAWRRYLDASPTPFAGGGVRSVTAEQVGPEEHSGVFAKRNAEADVTLREEAAKPQGDRVVTPLRFAPGGSGEGIRGAAAGDRDTPPPPEPHREPSPTDALVTCQGCRRQVSRDQVVPPPWRCQGMCQDCEERIELFFERMGTVVLERDPAKWL